MKIIAKKPVDPLLGTIEGFMKDMEIIQTNFGVRVLLRKHFHPSVDTDEYMEVGVQGKKFVFEYSHEIKDSHRKNVYTLSFDGVLIWRQERTGRGPVVPAEYYEEAFKVVA